MKGSIFILVITVGIFAIALINFKSPITLSEESASTKEITFKVDGMTCSMCPLTIKTALKKLDGVTNADVSYSDKEAKVECEDGNVTIQDIVKTIESAGNYKATPIDRSIEGA
jgi:periplasmic mercuric ion binding protein